MKLLKNVGSFLLYQDNKDKVGNVQRRADGGTGIR